MTVKNMNGLNQFALTQLAALEARQQRRVLRETRRAGVEVVQEGKFYVSFACNDYLGLSHHPQVLAAARAALEEGAGAGASRLVTGNHAYYAPLEAALAAHKGTEAALVFGSGYMANIGLIPALVGKGDLVLVDKLAHACILDGAQLSGATMKRFKHNDLQHLESLLAERAAYKNVLICTDHVFSMDGDCAPLAAMGKLAKAHGAWLMADDAHGIGFFDDYPAMGVDVWMGTLSKALGSYGGYVAASRAVIDYLTTSARSLVFTTGLPPSACAAAQAALAVMVSEPQRAEKARFYALQVAQALGLPAPETAILPVLLGSEEAALAASDRLKQQGLLAVAIRPPTVPPGTARLRLALSADHTPGHIEQLIAALKQEKLRA